MSSTNADTSVPAGDNRHYLTRDGWLLFATRCVRLFAYGLLSIVLVLYLAEVGLSDAEIGLLLTLTLLGDTAISLWLTTTADRIGRRRMLVLGALLMVLAGALFASSDSFVVLLLAATIGVISPSGNEVGPFLSIEQAALSQIVPGPGRTRVFAWYNLVGSCSTAVGALCGGALVQGFQHLGSTGSAAYRPAIIAYGILGLLLAAGFACVSQAVEIAPPAHSQLAQPPVKPTLGLHRSRRVVLRLAGLFSLDAFGGGFVIQSIIAYWLHLKFGLEPATLGGVFLGANLLAGVSALAAGWLAGKIGLVNTMVFTHLPSNILLMLVPLMPTAWLAVAVLLLRFSISQMDVPTRQSYTMAVVSPDERSAASGVTSVARSIGASLSPMLSAALVGTAGLASMPFFLAGGIKVVYDLLLYRSFISVRPPEERAPPR
ncbi:MAG: MFS transporter [Pirellulaceae bacterium]|nr:MFS transporter [Pirellulaceae bacterium]